MNKKLVMALTLMALTATGCQTVYNTTMEKVFGKEKRQLLKSAVASVSKDQQKAQVEFKDAMTQLKEMYNFHGGDLENVYNKLKKSYDDAQSQADTVGKRIDNMEGIAKSMFAEWRKEIKEYTNETFALNSQRQLDETQARYGKLLQAVRSSEASMKPVLQQLNDHVLYLKHNLNAASIGALQGEASSIQSQIERVISQMNSSIAEADSFIQTLAN